MIGAGVQTWLAERLLIFLPVAFTRRLLPDVSYQDGLVTPGGRVNLSAEPVFVAALAARSGLTAVRSGGSRRKAASRPSASRRPVNPGSRHIAKVAGDLVPAGQQDAGS